MNKKIFVREPYDMHILDEIGEQWAIVTLSDNNQERLFIGGVDFADDTEIGKDAIFANKKGSRKYYEIELALENIESIEVDN